MGHDGRILGKLAAHRDDEHVDVRVAADKLIAQSQRRRRRPLAGSLVAGANDGEVRGSHLLDKPPEARWRDSVRRPEHVQQDEARALRGIAQPVHQAL
jgi:hypothetical protein